MIRQFLSFTLNNALYAFDVKQVQEVLEYIAPVKVPCSEDYIEGLISSRNEGITVINLCKKFHLPSAAPTKKSRIIVLEKKRRDLNFNCSQSVPPLLSGISVSSHPQVDVGDSVSLCFIV